ncbi:response regulator [Colwellia ponticola]|uniref:Response regulator n=1 Tax=Colwellia ponticola TaxID=2304625 RepID=A0A8H2PMM4_9GAMM|nr:response regulator [Colwellia ponticola]TMM46819.1 response regulator [Colwellia ponticola]
MNILVVDDNKAVQERLAALIISQGHNVDLAINGLDALGKAQQGNYQLFVIDHLMPLMNGVQLTKNLKADESSSLVPVIFMTTQGKRTLKDIAEYSLFDKVIDKPINEADFITLLSEVIKAYPANSATEVLEANK